MTSTTGSTYHGSTPTLTEIVEAVKALGSEPYAEAMKARGCDPKDGWILVLPSSVRKDGYIYPEYVQFNRFITTPMCFDPSAMRF